MLGNTATLVIVGPVEHPLQMPAVAPPDLPRPLPSSRPLPHCRRSCKAESSRAGVDPPGV